MSRKKIIQLVSIGFLVLAVILFMSFVDWGDKASIWSWIILILGTGGSILSIFIPTSFVCEFEQNQWRRNNSGDYEIKILAKKHGLGKNPQIQTYELNANGQYEGVEVSSSHDNGGNVIVQASVCFRGRIILSK